MRSSSLAPTLTVLAGLLLGCPAKLPAGATALDKISLEGNKAVDDGDIEAAIASSPTSKVLGIRPWWVEYGIYDPVTVEKDLQRIERYYQARGYYEARVRAGRVIRVDDRAVRVQIVVEEGPLVTLSRVQVTGLSPLPEEVRRRFSNAWKLPPGDAFDEELYRKSGESVERALTDEGYAYAVVKLAADVDLVKHEAVVHIEVIPGPRCTFGKITITGLSELPEDKVRKVLMIEEGDRYSTRAMREAQNALFDLGTFDTVDFEPDLSDPTRTAIPVRVALGESKLRRVRAGPGFLVDPLRNDLHVTARWENRNFLGGLRRLSVEVRPMLIFKPGFFQAKGVRPGIFATTELRQPAFLEARTNGVLSGHAGIFPDPVNDKPSEYRVLNAQGSIGLDRRFYSIIYGGLFYRKALWIPTLYEGSDRLPVNAFSATLGYFELLGSIDTRDDLLKPTRGYFTTLSLQYAMGTKQFWGGRFGDVRLQPELRLYGPLAKGLTLAFRFTTGFLLPYNYRVFDPPRRNPTPDDPSSYQTIVPPEGDPAAFDYPFDATGATPAWRAFYSGGALGNRGYATRDVGLRDCAIDAERRVVERGTDCSVVVGGASLWESSIELRFDIAGPLAGVIFADMSDVSRRRFDIRLHYPHLSVGPGLRYFTPIGPLRLDFGWRVPGMQRIGGSLDPREQPREFNLGIRGPFALHLSIGEAF